MGRNFEMGNYNRAYELATEVPGPYDLYLPEPSVIVVAGICIMPFSVLPRIV